MSRHPSLIRLVLLAGVAALAACAGAPVAPPAPPSPSPAPAAPSLSLIPQVARIERLPGGFDLHAGATLATAPGDAGALAAARWFADHVRSSRGLALVVGGEAKPAIRFTRDPA